MGIKQVNISVKLIYVYLNLWVLKNTANHKKNVKYCQKVYNGYLEVKEPNKIN
jgi:hypothetical protein